MKGLTGDQMEEWTRACERFDEYCADVESGEDRAGDLTQQFEREAMSAHEEEAAKNVSGQSSPPTSTLRCSEPQVLFVPTFCHNRYAMDSLPFKAARRISVTIGPLRLPYTAILPSTVVRHLLIPPKRYVALCGTTLPTRLRMRNEWKT